MNDIPITSSIGSFKYLTIQGGGIKGLGYVGAIEELAKQGVLAQIEEVAGSSAGGLMATLLAVGCTPEEIRELMLDLDFRSLQDKAELGWIEATHLKDLFKGASDFGGGIQAKIKAIKNIPMIGGIISGAIAPITDPLSGLVKYGKMAGTAVTALGYAEKAEDIAGLVLGTGLGVWEGEALTHWLFEIIARKTGDPNTTFEQLAALAEVPGFPFKKLTLTGSNLTGTELQYFNAETTPNMSILQAARISASFPFGYKPVVTVEPGLGGEKKTVWVDGGLLENLPDVFNQEPYISRDGKNKQGGNPRALALSFVTPKEKEEKLKGEGGEISTFGEHGLAMFGAKWSEKKLTAKYGSALVEIDTKGVDTLEFDLTSERQTELVESGREEVKATFDKIREEEENEKKNESYYENFSDAELIRIITELEHKDSAEAIEELYTFNLALKGRKTSKERLEELQKDAEKTYTRKVKLMESKALSDRELSKVCSSRGGELKKLEKDFNQKLEELKAQKLVFELYPGLILTEFWQNEAFSHDLADLYRAHKKVRNKGGKEYEKLEQERNKLYKKIIDKYDKGGNKFLSGFFIDLEKNKDKPNFSVPIEEGAIKKYLPSEIREYEVQIKKVEREVNESKHQLHLFKGHGIAFRGRATKSKKVEALLHFKRELDSNIRRKTTVITKINHFIIRKSPRLKEVMKPFLKGISFLSFICTLPFAVPSVSLAKIIGKFSKNKETQETATNVVDFFRWTDMDLDVKLRGLREITDRCVKAMRDNYIESDNKELTILHQLHVLYLKDSGLDFKDIFTKKPDESNNDYKKRIGEIKKNYEPKLDQSGKRIDATFEAFEKALKEKKELEKVGIKSEGVYAKEKFDKYCDILTDHLKVDEKELEASEDYFKISPYKIEVHHLEDKSINIDLPDTVEELKKVFPSVADAWKECKFGAPLLNGPLENLEYMAKELMKREIEPNFEEEALAALKEKGYENKEEFLKGLEKEEEPLILKRGRSPKSEKP